jgi:tetratricopeptide (TPR) repeat protein
LYYGAQLGDSKRFKKYDDLIRLTKKKHLRAQKINSQLNILKLSFLLGKKSKAEILAEVNEIKKEWPEVPQEEQSYAFVYHQYQTRLLGESLQEDLTAVQQTCREAIQFITKYLKGRKGNEDRVFHLVAAFCLMKQGDFSAAIKEVEKTHKLEKKGSPLWFENMAFKIVIAIYTGHWDKAADLLKEVKSQSKFKLLLPKKMEVWMTLESYLNLMGDHGEVDKTLLSAPVKVHLGLSKEETLYHHSEGLYNTHHDIIEAIRVVAQQDQEGIKRASANLKASLGILREKGYFRLAAFAEFLSNVIQKKPTEIDWKEAGSAGDATWNAWPLLLDIQHRAFEEIVPFDRLLQYLRPLNNPIRVSNN